MNKLSGYDWTEVFKYAASEYCGPVLNYNGNASGFCFEDVGMVLDACDGENDGANWVGLFLLKDGRFASIRAGCDYTGWGCQKSGSSNVADTFDRMWLYGLDDDERDRLKDAYKTYLTIKIARI